MTTGGVKFSMGVTRECAPDASDSRVLFTAGLQLGCPALRKNVGLRCGVNKE
jgi:hypothetical protein